MKTRISVLIILLLISVNALACNPPQPTGVPNATPTVVKPTVNPTPPDGKVLTVEEFVANALAGKYKYNQTITVSGTIIGHGLYIEYLGPRTNKGVKVELRWVLNQNNGLQSVNVGDRVVVRGEYDGETGAIVSLDNSVLISLVKLDIAKGSLRGSLFGCFVVCVV